MPSPPDQLFPITHIVRQLWTHGQPPRWAVIECEDGTGPLSWATDGLLLGWQGWSFVLSGPVWRFWDPGTSAQEVWLWQERREEETQWNCQWWVGGFPFPNLLLNRCPYLPTANSFGETVFPFPWDTFGPDAEEEWLDGPTNVHWYRTYQEAVAAWPSVHVQPMDYRETFLTV